MMILRLLSFLSENTCCICPTNFGGLNGSLSSAIVLISEGDGRISRAETQVHSVGD